MGTSSDISSAEWLKCPQCSYDLRGLPVNRCPECGGPFDPEKLKARYLESISEPRKLTHPLICHLFLSGLVLFTLIMPYHISGRAWYDYGWDVPGKGRYGYDPMSNPPYTWPWIGSVLSLGSVPCFMFYAILPGTFTVGGVPSWRTIPPRIFVIATVAFVLAIPIQVYVKRGGISKRRLQTMLALWLIGCFPHFYMLINGWNVLEWLMD